MVFKNRKRFILNFALILTLMGGVFGAVQAKQALAAPQAQELSSNVPESDTCYPGTGWAWTNGPLRPDIAQQAELALSKQGIESTVIASEYGEKDSCGNFELFSMDFKVTLKNNSNRRLSPNGEAEFADGILATLSQIAKPQLGNVAIDFGTGNAKSYQSKLDRQTPLANVATVSSNSTEMHVPLNNKALVLVFNPTLSNGQDLNTYMGWPANAMLVQGIVNSLQTASGGQFQYTIVDTIVVADEWPVKIDGFRYTEETYLAVMQNGAPAHSPDEVDYNIIIDNPEWDICGKLNRGEIDELWMYGAPYFGFYESRLVGPGAYLYNSPPLTATHGCNKLLPIMGLSYERGVADAVHSFGHRAEASMTKVYGGWEQNRTAHNWDRFGLVKAQSPNYTYSGCGSVHFPPNGVAGYDYGNPGSTLTNCEDFSNYPNLSDPLTVAQPVTCMAWNCDHLDYMVYWFSHLPSNLGCGSDVVENNWWAYFADPNLALFPALNCPPVTPDPILPGNTVRASVNFAGGQTLNDSESAEISTDGHFVAFASRATNLVWGDTNGRSDVFVRDLQTGQITRVSVDSGGGQANDHSYNSSISADGRYIAFYSHATNLVTGDTNGRSDIFLHDRQTGFVTRISVDSGGVQSNNDSSSPYISANGRYIVFGSYATNLVPGDTNGIIDIFLHDLQTGMTTRISVNSSGGQANNGSTIASISADGRYIAFHSYARNLVPGDTNARSDVFLRDVQTSATTRVSVNSNGVQANNGDSFNPSISADGLNVAFESYASNLVPGDTNGLPDVFVRDTQTGVTTRVSIASSGVQGNSGASASFISGDGRYVGFISGATNLVPGDTNTTGDAFIYDRQTGLTTRVSIASDGTQANNGSFFPSISADGQYIAFQGAATNLVAGDTNGYSDIFVHRQDGSLPPTVTPTFTPTNTPTFTPTPTPASSSNNPLYLSLTGNQTVGGVASADEDILRFDGTNWSLFFDGSDVGVGSSDLFGFSIVDSDTILMAFSSAMTVNGISALPQDILQFDATSLGSVTTGTFSMYLNGIDVGLDTTAEKIDSVSMLLDGRVLISTTGNPVVTGVTGGKDEDVIAFTPTSLGNNTSGSWSMYFDGSDVGLGDSSGEDVDGLDVVNEKVYLSTADNFAVNGIAGTDEDVFVCESISLGDVTACNYSSTLYFDGSTWNLTANDVDAFNFLSVEPVPTVTPINTSTHTPTPINTLTPTNTFTPGPSLTPTDTPTYTPTVTATFTPTVTPTLGSSNLIFKDSFESGNFSAWIANTNDLGDLSVSVSAALVGTQGMQAVIDDANAIYVTDDTPNAEPRYRARFYFDPNSITMASNDAHFIFKGFAGTATDVFQVELRNSSGLYQIRAKVLNDSSTFVVTNWFTISDASHFIEVEWQAATASGANNGGLTLWIDGIQQANLTGIDNDTWRIDRARLGALAGMDAGTSGIYYFDAFESRRQNYIGP